MDRARAGCPRRRPRAPRPGRPGTASSRPGRAAVSGTPGSAYQRTADAVQLDLVDRLAGAGAAQLGRPVGGEHEQRHGGLVGLDDRRVEVRRRGARRAQHRDRAAGLALARPSAVNDGGPLVDPDVQPHPARPARAPRTPSPAAWTWTRARRRPRAARTAPARRRAPSPNAVDGFTAAARREGAPALLAVIRFMRRLRGRRPGTRRPPAPAAATAPGRSPSARARPGRPRGGGPAALRRASASGSRGDVAGQQGHRGQPARVGQLGQRGGEGDPGGQPDRGVDRAGHHDGQPAGLGHPQRRRGPRPAAAP